MSGSNQPSRSALSSTKALLIYFVLVTLLQWILFLSLYISRMDEGTFFPVIQSFPQELIARANPDLFRWSLDLGLILSLGILIKRFRPGINVTIPLTLMYLCLFVFQCYYYFVWKIYGELPIWTYDLALLKRVFPVFMKTMGLSPVLIFIGAGLLILLLFVLFRYIISRAVYFILLETDINIIFTMGFIFFIPFLLKLSLPKAIDNEHSKKSITWIGESILSTFTPSRVKSLPDLHKSLPYEEYATLHLKTKPNIYLIFIEAYGSIAGTVPPYDMLYADQLKSINDSLEAQGWHAATTLSNSTILGGRSWLGFTTLLSGVRIDNHPAYEDMIEHHVGYPHLIHTLNAQGYDTYRLNTMANPGNSFNSIDSIAGLYFQVKKWTRFNDIPYQGYRYDYMGGIPDQYALNFWHDHELIPSHNPYFLFFITLNTHAPFYLPPPIVENWKDLDAIITSPNGTTRLEEGAPIKRYSKEVSYILNVLQQFILQKATEHDLFILLGDHQPAGMEYMLHGKTDTYATPIHIVSKDTSWINRFIEHGFDAGMMPVFKQHSLLKHEGFYSFLMSIWAEKDSLSIRPAYLPDGIN